MLRVAEHMFPTMWTEVVVVVGSPERVPNRGQPFKVKVPQFSCGVSVVARQRAREASTGRSGIRNAELNRGLGRMA